MSEHFIERMTWPEVEAAIKAGVDTVLIPIGTTEQHGHHMPLDTDCVIARALCTRVADAAADQGLTVLVAPTVNISLSWYHMQFPGSMRLSTTKRPANCRPTWSRRSGTTTRSKPKKSRTGITG